MKLPITEVIENVKDELLCYEGAEQTAERWEKEFLQWVEDHKGKDKDIIVDGGQVSLKIRDEEEIFEIVHVGCNAGSRILSPSECPGRGDCTANGKGCLHPSR